AIAGALTINGDEGTDTLTVDDSGDTSANTGNLTATALAGLGMGPSGLTYGTVEVLTVNMGSGNDTFSVVGTAPGTTTTLNGGAGNDTFTGNIAGVIVNQLAAQPAVLRATPEGALSSLAAATPVTNLNNLFVNGEDGIDTLVLDDRADLSTTDFTVTSTQSNGTGIGAGGVQYNTVENLDLQPSPAGANYTILSTMPDST